MTHIEPLQAWAPNLQSLLPPAVGQTESEKTVDPWLDVPAQFPSKGPGDRNGRRVRPRATTTVSNEAAQHGCMWWETGRGRKDGSLGWRATVTRFEAGTWAV